MEENESILKEILDRIKGKKNVSKELTDFLNSKEAKYLLPEDIKRLDSLIGRGAMIDKKDISGLKRAAGLNYNREALNQTDRDLVSANDVLNEVDEPITRAQEEGREAADNWTRPLTQAQVEGRRRAETWTEGDRDSGVSSPKSGSNAGQSKASSSSRTREDVIPVDSAPELDDFDSQLLGLKTKLSNLGISVDESKLPSATTPANQEYLDKRFKVKNFLEDFKSTLGPIMSVIDHISAAKETKEAGRLVDRSLRESPAMPSVRGRNRLISNLIRESNIARSNPMRFVQPYVDQTNVGYNQDIQQARELSGGQAGVATGLGQAAALRRDEASKEAGLMGAEIYNQGLDRTSNLAQLQLQDEASRDALNLERSQYLINNNRQDQIAAGRALSSSRARQYQTRNNMYASLLDSPIFDVDTYMNLTKQNLRGI